MNYIAWMTEWLGSLIFEHNLITMDDLNNFSVMSIVINRYIRERTDMMN
jgi:hypothetical protein